MKRSIVNFKREAEFCLNNSLFYIVKNQRDMGVTIISSLSRCINCETRPQKGWRAIYFEEN